MATRIKIGAKKQKQVKKKYNTEVKVMETDDDDIFNDKPENIRKIIKKSIEDKTFSELYDYSKDKDYIFTLEDMPNLLSFYNDEKAYLNRLIESELDAEQFNTVLLRFAKVFPVDINEEYVSDIKQILPTYDINILTNYLTTTRLSKQEFYNQFKQNPFLFKKDLDQRIYDKLFNTTYLYSIQNILMKYSFEDIKYILKEFIKQTQILPVFLINYRDESLFELFKDTKNTFEAMKNEPDFDAKIEKLEQLAGTYPDLQITVNIIASTFDINLLNNFIDDYLEYNKPIGLKSAYGAFIERSDIQEIMLNQYKDTIDTQDQQFKNIIYNSNTQIIDNLGACKSMFKTLPWIAERVINTYISEVNGSIDTYILKTIPSITYNGIIWKRVNKNYYDLQCDRQMRREQSGDVLNFYTADNQLKLSIKVLYDIGNDEWLLQNEDIYNNELEYINKQSLQTADKISLILKEPITNESQRVALELIKRLTRRFMNTPDSKLTTEYWKAFITETAKQSSTIDDFALKIANVAVFLNNKLDPINCGIFAEQLTYGLYSPIDLLNVNVDIKLPEIFKDDFLFENQNNVREQVEAYINRLITEFKEDLVDEIFVSRNPYIKYNSRMYRRNTPDININLGDKWLENCKMIKTNYTNALTSGIASSIANIPSINMSLLTKTATMMKISIKPLLQVLQDDLKRLETLYNLKKDQEANVGRTDAGIIYENNEDEMEEDEYTTIPDTDTLSIDNTLADNETIGLLDGETDEGEHPQDMLFDDDDINNNEYEYTKLNKCRKCAAELADGEGQKTILWINKKPQVIKFCNLECIENFDFKKYKIKKKTKQ